MEGVDVSQDFLADDEGDDQPKSWQKDKKTHPLIATLGEVKWRMPSQLDSVSSQPTGPEQDPTFMTKVHDVCMHV